MNELAKEDIPPSPPPYSPPANETEPSKTPESGQHMPVGTPQQQQYLAVPPSGHYDYPPVLNPSPPPPQQPVITPMMMPQPVAYPCSTVPDKPVNVVVNANGAAGGDDRIGCDYRICHFCKRGIMERKKDWLRVIGILLASMLCPPVSFLLCIFLCTHVVYIHKCTMCQRISKRRRKEF